MNRITHSQQLCMLRSIKVMVNSLIHYYCCPLKIKRCYKQRAQRLAYLPKLLRNYQNCIATLQPLTLLAVWKQTDSLQNSQHSCLISGLAEKVQNKRIYLTEYFLSELMQCHNVTGTRSCYTYDKVL